MKQGTRMKHILRFYVLLSCIHRNSSWTIETYPIPDGNHEQCRTKVSYRFCDPDRIISDEDDIAKIENMIQWDRIIPEKEETSTSETSSSSASASFRVQYGVALMKKMQAVKQRDPDIEEKDQFAQSIHNRWGVGYNMTTGRGGGTGVVIVLSELDRYVYISRGSHLQDRLTNRRLDKVMNGMKPLLRKGSYAQALIHAIEQLDDILYHQGKSSYYYEKLLDYWDGICSATPLLMVISGMIYLMHREQQKKKEYDKVAHQLNDIDQQRAQALQGIFQAKSCPICLEPFLPPNQCSLTTTDGTGTNRKNQNDDDPIEPLLSKDSTGNDDNDNKNVQEEDIISSPSSTKTDEATTTTKTMSPATNRDGVLLMGSDHLPLTLLRCGHVFDTTCWEEWITRGSGPKIHKCPICQQDVNPSSTSSSRTTSTNATTSPPRSRHGHETPRDRYYTTTTTTTESSSSSCTPATEMNDASTATTTPSEQQYRMNQYIRERNFRLHRLSMRYPRYVTPSHIQRWTSVNYDGTLVNDPLFVRMNPQHHHDASGSRHHRGRNRHSSSSSRSSSGFGGGTSGGGRGSSW